MPMIGIITYADLYEEAKQPSQKLAVLVTDGAPFSY
jgi:hypothetical protein